MSNKKRVFLGIALAFGFFMLFKGFSAYAEEVNTAISPQLNIYSGPDNQTGPVIAYDSLNQRFLVVWSSGSDIYGQLVNADGTFLGNRITIIAGNDNRSIASVAFDPLNRRFLVAWFDNRLGFVHEEDWRRMGVDPQRVTGVYGQLINSDGTVVGGSFLISPSPYPFNPGPAPDAPGPAAICALSYDNSLHRFFVLTAQCSGYGYCNYHTHNLYGQFINPDGSLSGGYFALTDSVGQGPRAGLLSYDSNHSRFLVIIPPLNSSDHDYHGRMLNADGAFYTDLFTIPLSRRPDSANTVASAAFDSLHNRFLLAWYASPYSDYVKCRLLNADGSLYGDEVLVSQYYSSGGLAIFDPTNNKFLVTGDKYGGIFGQWVNPDASLSGANFIIDPSSGNAFACFGSAAVGSLVAWDASFPDTGRDILARLVRLTSTTGSISGKVTREDGVTPISGADVNVALYGEDGTKIIKHLPSQADGTYHIDNLEPGEYRVHVYPPYGFGGEYYNETDDYGWATPVIVRIGQETQDVNFTLPLGGEITGYLYEPDGVTPVPGEFLTLLKADGSHYGGFGGIAGQDGSYRLRCAYGNYKLTAAGMNSDFKQEYYNGKARYDDADIITVGPGNDPGNINFTLNYGISLSGLVFDKNFNRVPQAAVWYSGPADSGNRIRGDINGQFLFKGMVDGTNEETEIKAWPDVSSGYAASGYSASGNIYISPLENIKNYPLICLDGALATGYIRDASGNPAAFAKYWAGSRNLDVWGRTDSNGRYQIRIPPGRHWINFDDDSPERSALPGEIVVTDTAQPVTLPEITLYDASTGAGLSGQIINTGSFPKEKNFSVYVFDAATTVDINSFYGLSPVKAVDEIENAGPFNFPALPPNAAYQLFLAISNFETFPEYISIRDVADNLSVPAAGVNLTYSSAGGIIQGKVLDSAAKPVLGAQIFVLRQSDNRFMGYAASNENGDYKLYNFQPGAYNVIATHPKYPDSLPVQIALADGQIVISGSFVLSSNDEQAIRDGYAEIESAAVNKDINAVMEKFSDNYLDRSQLKNDMRDYFLGFFNQNHDTSYKFDLKQVEIAGERALVKCDFTSLGLRNSDNKLIKESNKDELHYFRKESGIWKVYGNQEAFDCRVGSGYLPNGEFMIDFSLFAQPGLVTSVVVSGPGAGALSLYDDGQHYDGGSGDGRWWNFVNLGSQAPSAGSEYTFTITDASNNIYTRKGVISNTVKKTPALISPVNNVSVSGRPLFKWSEVPLAWSYRVEVSKGGFEPRDNIWSCEIYGKKNTQVKFEEFGSASEPLQNGQVYSWRISANDQDRNWAMADYGTFTYNNHPPLCASVYIANTIRPFQDAYLIANFSDPEGAADIASAQINIADTASERRCLIDYRPASRQLYLWNEAAYTWEGPVIISSRLPVNGGSIFLDNGSVKLNCSGSFARLSGKNLILYLRFQVYNPANLKGAKHIFTQATDTSSSASGWQDKAAVTIRSIPGIAHTPVSLAARGQPVEFTAAVTDYSGKGIKKVSLFWRKIKAMEWGIASSSNMAGYRMLNTGGSTYRLTLQPADIGSRGVYYYILAEDNDGNTTRLPVDDIYKISVK